MNKETIEEALNKFDSLQDYCDVDDNSSWTFTNKSGVEVTVITKKRYDEMEQYKALEKELGLSSSEIKDCVIALKGLINTFDITCDSKVRMSDMLDGINGFPFYKDLVYHKEITKAIELLKEKNE
jgi:hypothetical protein